MGYISIRLPPEKAMDLISEEMRKNISFEEFIEIVSDKVIQDKLKRGNKKAHIIIKENRETKKLSVKTKMGELEIKNINSYHVVRNEKNSSRRYISAKIKGEVVRRDENRCIACKKSKKLHFHHLKPKSLGGKNSSDNIVLLCSSCHALLHLNYIKIRSDKFQFIVDRKNDTVKTFTDYLYMEKRKTYLNSKSILSLGKNDFGQLSLL